ncbi:MAG TPA: serine hydrolase domain-containing protein [Gemmatales bacterium]|nr:serine hydrolase domain-containing protein [Gemmatales bacterium]
MMKQTRRTFLGSALAATWAAGNGSWLWAEPPCPAAVDPKIVALLEPVLAKHELPALAAAVVGSQGLRAVGVVGVRKRGDETLATVQDQFHLGSNTKAMTATLMGRLVEEGKLEWERTVGAAFPSLVDEIPPALQAVTLEQLLSHRSGLPGEFAERRTWIGFASAGPIRAQRLAVLKKAAQEKHEPAGAKMVYSNMNYVIAAAMAEEATDTPWEELIQDKLFRPLGITTAGFGPMGQPGAVIQPWQHHGDGRPQPPVPQADNVPAMGPAGRVHMSLPDWAKYVADQLKGARGEPAYLSKATYEKLHSSPTPTPFYTVGGWGGRGEPRRSLGHDGCNTMNYASAVLIPDQDVAVLVVTNQGTVNGAGQKGCREAREALLREFAPKPSDG